MKALQLLQRRFLLNRRFGNKELLHELLISIFLSRRDGPTAFVYTVRDTLPDHLLRCIGEDSRRQQCFLQSPAACVQRTVLHVRVTEDRARTKVHSACPSICTLPLELAPRTQILPLM